MLGLLPEQMCTNYGVQPNTRLSHFTAAQAIPTALLNGGDSHPINMQGLELILPEVQVKELLRVVPSNVQVLTHTEGHALD